MAAELVITDIGQLLTLYSPVPAPRRGKAMADLGLIRNAAVAVTNGRIAAVGTKQTLLKKISRKTKVISAGGRLVTPGLVDPHTHAVFAGNRAGEFEQRLAGQTYQEIAAAGGGIQATVRATRRASERELETRLLYHLTGMLSWGTTTVEVKSGYGLSLTSELKLLNVIKRAQKKTPLDLVPTFLGAHTVPREFRHNRKEYVKLLCERMLPAITRHKVACFSDVFTERGAFSLAESKTIQRTARSLGFALKFHVDELSPLGGAELAAEMGATSADHLEFVSERGIRALARSGTVAVLLPSVSLFLGLKRWAPARRLIAAGVPVALASDFNPGTSPTYSLPLVMSLACFELKMTPAEVWAAATLNAAYAAGLGRRVGSLKPGKQADLVIWQAADYREIPYHLGVNQVERVIKEGKVVL